MPLDRVRGQSFDALVGRRDWRGHLRVFRLVGLIVLAVLAAPLAADAQQAGKVARIGLLSPASPPPPSSPTPVLDAFRQGLRELGWMEGQNIAFEHRYAEGRIDPLPELAAEFVGLKVDVIVAVGFPAARVAKRATSTVPIVMVHVTDPVGTGLVASLARPGGNVTGLASFTLELEAKRLELLKEAVPKLRRVAYLWNAAIQEAKDNPHLRDLQVTAGALGARLQSVEVRGAEEWVHRDDPGARRGAPCARGPVHSYSSEANRGPGSKEPAAAGIRNEGVCRGRRAHILWGEPP